VTHRIVGVTSKENNVQYETKGDHNKAADTDLVPSQNVVAQYSGFTIPYIGYILDFAQSKKGTSLLLIVSGILLLGFAIFTFFQVVRELEKKPKSIETNENTI
jgi:signal peptidase